MNLDPLSLASAVARDVPNRRLAYWIEGTGGLLHMLSHASSCQNEKS